MSIPRDIAAFFDLPENGLTAPKAVQLDLGGSSHDAHIHNDATGSRYRLLWKADFAERLIDRFPYAYRKYALNEAFEEERPMIRFKRIRPGVYAVELIEPSATPGDMGEDAADWTDRELEAVIYVYFTMLSRELRGRKYNRSEVIRQLRGFELIDRSRGSIEFRLQNISSVLQELCHPVIQGYLPRMHVRPEFSERIRKIIFDRKFLNEREYTPTHDESELEKRVKALLGKELVGTPKGRLNPRRMQESKDIYERDPLVKAWVMQHAQGICELCGEHGPFRDRQGEWFLEEHHVVPLADGGPDSVENTVALCPNCHRKCHASPDAGKLREDLRYTIDRIG
jgi:5-methylcytosine-specific restriction protein A